MKQYNLEDLMYHILDGGYGVNHINTYIFDTTSDGVMFSVEVYGVDNSGDDKLICETHGTNSIGQALDEILNWLNEFGKRNETI